MKKTKSFPTIDLPYKIRKEFAVELSAPLTNIMNSCLRDGKYPVLWKFEWVTPIPKTNNPAVIKDPRKLVRLVSTVNFLKVLDEMVTKRYWPKP